VYFSVNFPHWLRITSSSMSGDAAVVRDSTRTSASGGAARPGLALDTDCETCGPPVTIWEGGTAGAALIGAFHDYDRKPVIIDIPPSAPGRRLLLSITASEEKANWSVTELRVFGR
ncbi:MAG: hypothetical protein ABI652_01450, partial [Acidobacteriota bacterium]